MANLYYKNTINTFLKKIDTELEWMDIGFYNGIAGVLFILELIKNDISAECYSSTKNNLVKRLSIKTAATEQYDIISGLAGLIIFITQFYSSENKELNNILIMASKKLLELAVYKNSMIVFEYSKSRYLGGFSHGVSGVAYAAFLLANEFNDKFYLDFAEKCLQYELSLFDASKGKFIDKRLDYLGYGNSWCHGYPGTSMALCKAHQLTNKEIYREYVLYSINNFRPDIEKESNFCLCHGVLGNFAIEERVLKMLNNNTLSNSLLDYQVDKMKTVLDRSFNPYKKNKNKFIPGLMTGISGIGLYALGKLLNNDIVAPVLLIN